jgi:acylphosphatase
MNADPSPVVRHVIIRGRVQGVGYRAWTEREALRRGLEGFVRNRRDGSVEAVFVGLPAIVAEMVAACRRGPPGARIDDISAADADRNRLAAPRPGERFSVLPTV